MKCSRCGRAASTFDVHCPACGAELYAPSLDQQLTHLGLTLNVDPPPLEELGPQKGVRIARALLGVAGLLAGGMWEATRAFIAACVGGRWEQEYRSEKVIERAIRRSRR
jgi:hypothetical protein